MFNPFCPNPFFVLPITPQVCGRSAGLAVYGDVLVMVDVAPMSVVDVDEAPDVLLMALSQATDACCRDA